MTTSTNTRSTSDPRWNGPGEQWVIFDLEALTAFIDARIEARREQDLQELVADEFDMTLFRE